MYVLCLWCQLNRPWIVVWTLDNGLETIENEPLISYLNDCISQSVIQMVGQDENLHEEATWMNWLENKVPHPGLILLYYVWEVGREGEEKEIYTGERKRPFSCFYWKIGVYVASFDISLNLKCMNYESNVKYQFSRQQDMRKEWKFMNYESNVQYHFSRQLDEDERERIQSTIFALGAVVRWEN